MKRAFLNEFRSVCKHCGAEIVDSRRGWGAQVKPSRLPQFTRHERACAKRTPEQRAAWMRTNRPSAAAQMEGGRT